VARYKKRNKPKRKKIPYKGQLFASQSEVTFAKTMDHNNIPWKYESESFEYFLKPKIYTPDFKIKRPDGTTFFVEYKGFLWNEDKAKMIAVRKQYPKMDIRFVFADARKPVHGAKTRKNGTKQSHGEWADQNGYLWAEGFMPPSWLKTQKGRK
jgi:hypothetical protein